MPGCPFNAFGPCMEKDCSFFLGEKEALNVLATVLPGQEKAKGEKDRCIIWLMFLAAHETLGHSGLAERETDRIVSSRQEYLQPGGLMAPELHFRMIESILDRLDGLESLLRNGDKP